MSNDEELLKEMALQKESPDDPNMRRIKRPQYTPSKYSKEDLEERFGNKVWVRCISEAGPWADGVQLAYWTDYEVPVAEAIMLDERRFAVILATLEAELDEDEDEDEEDESEASKEAAEARRKRRLERKAAKKNKKK